MEGPEAEIMARKMHYAAWFSILEDCVSTLSDAANANRPDVAYMRKGTTR